MTPSASVKCNVLILRLLATSRHTDFEIVCAGRVFKVHKAILAASSGYYDRLCDSGFSEGTTARSTLDEDPALVARMIIFAYTMTYHTESLQSDRPQHTQFKTVQDAFGDQPFRDDSFDWETRARLHASLYGIADKYELEALTSHTRQRFCIAFDGRDEYSEDVHRPGNPDWVFDADKAEAIWAKEASVSRIVYATTPHTDRSLRDMVVEYNLESRDSDNIEERNAYLGSREMLQVISSVPDFAIDLATKRHSSCYYECEICKCSCFSLAARCPCGRFDSCSNEDCVRKAKMESWCNSCKRLGTVSLVSGDEMETAEADEE